MSTRGVTETATSPWELDQRAVRAAFGRASAAFGRAAFMHAEARARLLQRLDWVRLDPELAIDLGAGLAEGAAALAGRYPRARVLAVDASWAMLAEAGGRLRGDGPACITALAERLPFAAGSVDLVFANLLVPWIGDLYRLFSEWRRVLRPSGLVTFTSLGPDTLHELARAWATVEDLPHTHAFYDMHDVGDALLACGLREPVLDVEHLRVTYPSVEALARELKACGAQNATRGRRRTLTGPARWQAMVAAYPRASGPNPVEASVELVFAHAWGSPATGDAASEPRVTAVPVEAIKRRR